MPSVKTGNESPTFGNYMKFNLTDETGIIEQGYNKVDMGIFQGDSFFTDHNEDIYIEMEFLHHVILKNLIIILKAIL